MSFLITLPTALIILTVTVTFVVASVAGLLVVRRLVPLPVLREHNDVAGFIFAALGVIYAVILAFLVIAVWESFEENRRLVGDEAGQSMAIFRQVEAFPTPEREAVQEATRTYVRAIVEEDWPSMREDLPSPMTDSALESLWVSVRSIQPGVENGKAWYDATVESLGSLSDLRDVRLSEAEQRLPDVMTLLLLLGATITIAYTYLYGVRNIYGQVAMTAALAFTIGLVISLVIMLDAPFHGDTSIGPQPFIDALAFMGSGSVE